jgi:23S rRNA pseudouridine2605 synthase
MPQRPSQRGSPSRHRVERSRTGNASGSRRAPHFGRRRDGGTDAAAGEASARDARPRIRRGEPAARPAETAKLQKRLAEAGLGSRRAMEELIQAGQVSVNGRVATLGMRVGPDDRIAVAGKLIERRRAPGPSRLPRIVLYHKPEGEIVSRSDPEGRPSVFDRVPVVRRGRWLAVGRLDFNTCGLLIFTDSGELTNRLTHPRFQARRDYAVRVVGELTPEQIRTLRSGVALDDGPARFEILQPQGGEGTNRWYRVRVREGRNRLVRRLFAAAGITVSRLMRTGFGPFDLPPRVKRGHWLKLEPDEAKQALARLEQEEGRAGGSRPARAPKERFSGVARAPKGAVHAAPAGPHRPRRRFPAK